MMSDKDESRWRALTLKENRLTTFFLAILVLFALGFILKQLHSIFKPLAIAIFLSAIFEPMVIFFTRLKIPKFFAFLITLIIVFVILYLLGLIVLASVASFTEEFPRYQVKFNALYKNIIGNLKIPHEQVQSYIEKIKWTKVWENLSLTSFFTSTVGSFINFLVNLFLVLLFTLYIVLGKEHLMLQVCRAFPGDRAEKTKQVIQNLNAGVQKYLVAKTLISLGTGIVATIILLIFDVDFAILWGMLTFLLNFIPNIGSVIATIPPIFVAFFQYGSIFPAVWIAILLVGTQMTMGNLIEPRVMGKSLNLNPLVVIISLIFWGFIWGPVGMVLAVPISATIQIICANIDPLKPVSILMGGE
ncbi:AI-2E family transporter [bacterium]|nr:AI-2E family transporter [bacterium]